MPPVKPFRLMLPTQTDAAWSAANPLPYKGEIVVVYPAPTNPGYPVQIKIGDGVSFYNQLPFYNSGTGEYQGIAVPATNPPAGPSKKYYFVKQAGNYTHFPTTNPVNPAQYCVVPPTNVLGLLSFNGLTWSYTQILSTVAGDDQSAALVYVVRHDGIVPTNCDFTTITAALQAAAAVASTSNKVRLHVVGGIYTEAGQNGNGLELVDYVDIIGYGEQSVYITNYYNVVTYNPAAVEGNLNAGVICKIANCTVENVTLIGKTTVCLRNPVTTALGTKNVLFRNVIFHKQSTFGTPAYDIDLIAYLSQRITFENCRFYGQGMKLSSEPGLQPPTGNIRDQKQAFKVSFKGCEMLNFLYTDYRCYSPDLIEIIGCKIKYIRLFADSTAYNNPGPTYANNPNIHQAIAPQLTVITGDANKIGRFVYDVTTWAAIRVAQSTGLRGSGVPMPGHNETFVVNPAANVIEGMAMTRAADLAANLSAVLQATKIWGQCTISNAGNRLLGFATYFAATTGNGWCEVQRSGNPLARFSTANGNAAIGDPLQLVNGGFVAKRTTGEAIAYATQAMTVNNTTYEIEMIPTV